MKAVSLLGLLSVFLFGPVPARQAGGLTAALLLDVSASVSQQSLRLDDRFVRIFNAFVQRLQPGDRAAVGVLTNRLRLSTLTPDVRELSANVRMLLQIQDIDRLGPTPIWDALDEAITLVADGRGRPVIVLYSDGRSSGNLHGLADVLAHATRTRVSINVVVPPQKLPVDHLNPADLMEELSSATGGRRMMEPRPPGNAAAVISQLMEGLREGR